MISEQATRTVLETLTLSPLEARQVTELAVINGSVHGYRDSGPLEGALIRVHHAGSNLFLVEVS